MANMKHVFKTHANIMFLFNFSNHARARVPIFTLAAPHFDKQNEDGVRSTLLSFGTNGKLSTFLSLEGLSNREQTSILKCDFAMYLFVQIFVEWFT